MSTTPLLIISIVAILGMLGLVPIQTEGTSPENGTTAPPSEQVVETPVMTDHSDAVSTTFEFQSTPSAGDAPSLYDGEAPVQDTWQGESIAADRDDEDSPSNETMGLDDGSDTAPSSEGSYASGLMPAGASEFVAVCQEELADWEAGIADSYRYKHSFCGDVTPDYDPHPGGWCGMFIGYCAGRIGSSCVNWQGDAFPSDPTTPRGYYDYYTEHPEAGTLYEATGNTIPKPGDLVLMWEGAHVEMVEEIDADGSGYWCISGGGSVDHNYHDVGSDSVTWFVTPNWDAIG